ncbi:MAG: helix-turn-helix transcriptional regulator [Bacillota bacterium]
MKFSERLKELRQERNLTTTSLGKEIGVSNSTISRWENEEIVPTIIYLYKLAVFLKLVQIFLIGLSDEI